jgi:hypothetical protein
LSKVKRKEVNRKVKEWVGRYLTAEIVSTVLSLAAAFLVKYIWDNDIMSAYAGSIVASISFYGLILLKDVRSSQNKYKAENRVYNYKSFLKDFRNLLVEFGPSEIFDVVLVRPFCMYIFPKLMGNFMLGTFVGKLFADFIFYIPAIFMYEMRKKHLKN